MSNKISKYIPTQEALHLLYGSCCRKWHVQDALLGMPHSAPAESVTTVPGLESGDQLQLPWAQLEEEPSPSLLQALQISTRTSAPFSRS